MNYIIANSNINLKDLLNKSFSQDYYFHIYNKEDLSFEKVKKINPKYIFFPHWSFIIPKEIFENFECIVFHMTDLPYGRGGSPLQNLIVRGHTETKISALRVVQELDAGPIYMKTSFSLLGNAEEIFIRVGNKVINMVNDIILQNPIPQEQSGEPVLFKRRKPEMSNIEHLENIEEIYDYIRMLDAEGYPRAFIETGNFKIEFSRATKKSNETIIADVRIFKK